MFLSVAMLQNASSGTDTLQNQLSNHWTVIGDMAFMEIETPVSCILLTHVCHACLYWCPACSIMSAT